MVYEKRDRADGADGEIGRSLEDPPSFLSFSPPLRRFLSVSLMICTVSFIAPEFRLRLLPESILKRGGSVTQTLG